MAFVAFLVIGLAIIGCGGEGGSAGATDSGIRGTVLIGPTCAVERVGENCADEPYATELRIVDAGAEEQVGRVSSDAKGRFELALPAGRYRIEPASSTSPPSAAPVEVNVPPHHYATATLRFDSGIR